MRPDEKSMTEWEHDVIVDQVVRKDLLRRRHLIRNLSNEEKFWGDTFQPEDSVQFSHSVVFDSLRPHGLQHARLPCPSPTPRAYSNSCPLSQWCHPTISSSVVPFCSHLWSFPASGSFPMSQFFTSGGQSIGVSASASVLPMNIRRLISFWIDWFEPDQMRGLASVKVPRQKRSSAIREATIRLVLLKQWTRGQVVKD